MFVFFVELGYVFLVIWQEFFSLMKTDRFVRRIKLVFLLCTSWFEFIHATVVGDTAVTGGSLGGLRRLMLVKRVGLRPAS